MEEEKNEIIKPSQQNRPGGQLTDIYVADESVALNLMVSFLNLANKRGIFSLEEAGKIWECVKKFQKN